MATRKLEIFEHDYDKGAGKSSQSDTVELRNGKLYVGASAAEIVDSLERRLSHALGHSPTDEEIFNELANYSNGYIGGREIF